MRITPPPRSHPSLRTGRRHVAVPRSNVSTHVDDCNFCCFLSKAVGTMRKNVRRGKADEPHQSKRETKWASWKTRSEEHTSELQSLMRISYAVFCLKKKNTEHTIHKNKQDKTPNN